MIPRMLPAVALCFCCTQAWAQQERDYFDLSLQELAQITVTSVSKRAESLSRSAAAVFVLTREDIRRSGASQLPDLLRMVPGVQVAQMDANDWAISVRGFNRQFSNKLLVLIDGRTVYTPLFSGVFWDAQDVMLEDIERIEVIRGPGGALWGANAVNGVINIITREAKDTQGTLVTALAGNQEQGMQLRQGMALANGGHARIYGKWSRRGETRVAAGEPGAGGDMGDDWRSARAGFRADWPVASQAFTLQGDAYELRENGLSLLDSLSAPFYVTTSEEQTARGANLLGRWARGKSGGERVSLQVYYDFVDRDNRVLNQRHHTLDFDLQHHPAALQRHHIAWGVGYRVIQDELRTSPFNGVTYLDYDPERRTDDIFSAFVQDQISLLPDRLQLTLGSKFEHNDYTGLEVQPSVRLAWNHDYGILWGAVSRAVRTPTRGEHSLNLISGVAPPGFVGLIRNEADYGSEELIAYELGLRNETATHVNYDLTLFYNDYDQLRTFEPIAPFGVYSLPLEVSNRATGESFGFEASGTWQVTRDWRLSPAYSWSQLDVHLKPGSQDILAVLDETSQPQQQFSLRSWWSVRANLQFDTALYYVDELPRIDTAGHSIPDYWRFDARLAWKPRKGLEVSLIGQNLFDSYHPEFDAALATRRAEIPRSLFVKLTFEL